ncbi:hypothetical protein Tco_0489880 [Tanacetum coccineum]
MSPFRAVIRCNSNFRELGPSSKARKESASSKRRKSLSPNGVKVKEEVETIGSYHMIGSQPGTSKFVQIALLATLPTRMVISSSYTLNNARIVFNKLLSRIRGTRGLAQIR